MQLFKGKHWEVVFVDWCQEFPGQCIISSKKEKLSDLTNEEWIELGLIEKELERVCKKLFESTMFNFACLMNDAYRDNKKSHVHFHFIPRYKDERKILNNKYVDRHFGYNMWKWSLSKFKCQKDIFTNEEKIMLFDMMKEEFDNSLGIGEKVKVDYNKKEQALLNQERSGPYHTRITELNEKEFNRFVDKLIKDDKRRVLIFLISEYNEYNCERIFDYFLELEDVDSLIDFLNTNHDFPGDNELTGKFIVRKLKKFGDKDFIKKFLDDDSLYFLNEEEKEELKIFIL